MIPPILYEFMTIILNLFFYIPVKNPGRRIDTVSSGGVLFAEHARGESAMLSMSILTLDKPRRPLFQYAPYGRYDHRFKNIPCFLKD